MDDKFVINIGRQLGSGGRIIGEKLAKRFGIGFYDKELIILASKDSGLCSDFFEKADEETESFSLGGLFGMRFSFYNDTSYTGVNCLSHDSLFKIQSDVIRRLADTQSCVFVGRCADYILRDHPLAINIFISSPLDVRIKQVSLYHHIPANEAENMIEKIDRKRAIEYNYYTYKDEGVAASYQVGFDSAVFGRGCMLLVCDV